MGLPAEIAGWAASTRGVDELDRSWVAATAEEALRKSRRVAGDAIVAILGLAGWAPPTILVLVGGAHPTKNSRLAATSSVEQDTGVADDAVEVAADLGARGIADALAGLEAAELP